MAEMTCDQFDEWMAFYQIEPWGGNRDDWRFGILVAWIVKAMTGKDVRPDEVFTNLKEQRELTPDELARQIEARAMAMGAMPVKR